MKNLSKLLCAVLVIAMLCTSLVFMVGAEEETPAYTSVPADTLMTKDAVFYSAEDNLITYFSRQSNTANGWNGEQARQAHVVTNNLTGETWYREWFEGDAYLLKDGGEPAGVGGNEYIQFNFEKQTLVYEEGYNEYIIVDMDLAYKAKTATIWDKTKYVNTSYMKQEVIGRGDAGTSWATVQQYKDFGLGDGFKHVTAVYDYSTGNAHIFVNGKLATTYANGALTSKVTAAYLSGTAVTVEEWRIGSNSADEIHMDNAYVRYAKSAKAEDTLATAISTGNISAWTGNIYDADYVVPTPYWFVKTAEHTLVPNYTNNINTTSATVIDNTVAGNLYVGQSTSIGNGFDVLGATQSTADATTYVTFFGARTGDTQKKNIFWQFNTAGAPNLSVTADTTAYYVVDLDLATHGEALPYIDVSVMLRRVSDGGGFPFSVNVEAASYIDPHSEWNHITIVGDMAANQCYVYVNGVYAGNPGYAYNSSQLSGNTELSPKGIRVDLGLSSTAYDVVAGQNIAFDNFAQRCYTNAEAANGLAEAVAAGNLNGWANHINGNAGEKLPVIATVNGVGYSNSKELSLALTSNNKLNVEFFSVPFAPVTLQATATVKTNGFDKNSLFTLAPSCEILTEQDGVITTYAPFAENVSATQPFNSGVNGGVSSVTNAIKYNVPGNLFTNFQPVSLQLNGQNYTSWGSAGFRFGELVTNGDDGNTFYRESGIPLADGTMADGIVVDASGNVVGYKEAEKGDNTFIRSNEYSNFKFSRVNLKYEAGKNEYIVVDFDLGIYEDLPDWLNFQIIPRVSGSGSWASDIYINDIPGLVPGEMAHLTIVFDYTTNNAHLFLNGAYVSTVAEGAMDGDFSGSRTDGNKWADRYMKGEAFTVEEFKLCSDRKLSSVCIDNMAIRAYDLAASEDVLGAAVAAGDITTWSDSIYNSEYKTAKFPALASVDGVDVGSVAALNALLAQETAEVKNVNFKHTPDATIVVKTPANVETNGLNVNFDYKTGLYTFHHSDPYYVCTGTDYAYASSRLVLAHEDGATVYSFVEINEANCDTYAVPVVWFKSLDPETVEVVYYVHGEQIAPISSNDAYIENGKLTIDQWFTMDMDYNVGAAVESFPVSSNTLSEMWFLLSSTTTETDLGADVKQNAVVSSNITLNVYVEKNGTDVAGETVVIDGVEYVKQSHTFAPAQFTEKVEVSFVVTDENGKTYLQKESVSFLDYAATILADANQNAETKAIVAAAVKYANEAYKLFNGETVAEADALLAANEAPEAAAGTVYNTADLSTVIRSAAMKLNANPEFLFKVARGFKGTLTFSYNGANGAVTLTTDVDATASEQLVTLSGFDVSDIFEDITITATAENGATVTGKYNLSSYAAGLADPAFANALVAYAQAAKAYKAKYAVYYEGKLNVTDLDAAAVESETLKTIVATKIKQCDQANPGSNPAVDPFAEGGTPRYVLANKGDGTQVEALYFSRSVAWTGTEKAHFTEFRFAVNGEKAGATVTKITFDYLVNGTVKENSRFEFTGLQGEKFFSDAYVQIKTPSNHPLAGDNYPELSGTDLTLDGQWHTMEIDLGEGVEIIDILLNLYQFQGELLIANLELTYA